MSAKHTEIVICLLGKQGKVYTTSRKCCAMIRANLKVSNNSDFIISSCTRAKVGNTFRYCYWLKTYGPKSVMIESAIRPSFFGMKLSSVADYIYETVGGPFGGAGIKRIRDTGMMASIIKSINRSSKNWPA
jgi:hypothetical protein